MEMHESVARICAPLTGRGASPPSVSETNNNEFGGAIFTDPVTATSFDSKNAPSPLAANYTTYIVGTDVELVQED